MRDLVIGIDASTTAVKGCAIDSAGRLVAEARAAYPLSSPAPGFFEQDAEDWWAALVAVLRQIGQKVGAERIAALAIGHQRETFVVIDEAGAPLIPAILWLDERARAEVARLSAELGRVYIRDSSGKPPDPTPALYGLAWLAGHRPAMLRGAHAVLDVQGFLVHRLTGRLVTSIPSADPLGMVHVESGAWDPRLVAAAGLRHDQLPGLVGPGVVIGTLTAAVLAATSLDPGTLVISGAGDGQAAGLGVGIIDEARGYLSLGSGVVSGMYSRTYHTSDAYRTLASPTGPGFMLETVLRSGMQLIDWTLRTLGGPGGADAATLAGLVAAAEATPPGSGGLFVLPYWAGVMNPYWDESARGAILGLTLDHKPGHLFRAAIEGIAFEQAVATAALESSIGRGASSFIVSGGGTKSALMMRIMAAVLSRPLAVSPVAEAVALGAAVLAGKAIGWFDSIEAAVAAMVAVPAEVIPPDPVLVAAYAPLIALYRDMFPVLQGLFGRMDAAGRAS